MNPTLDQLSLAKSVLDAELRLLDAKVKCGQCLRAGERKFLLGIVTPADIRAAYLSGYKDCLMRVSERFGSPGNSANERIRSKELWDEYHEMEDDADE